MGLLAVICPLDITAGDRAWIANIRSRHDPQHVFVEPHFTLVFPLAGVGSAALARHVEQIAERTSAIAFRLNRAVAVRDSLAPQTHVFLTPDTGDLEIRNLHGTLYSGELSSRLRADILYQPHVTVAAFDSETAAERLIDEIGEFEILGSLRALAIMSVNKGTITRQLLLPLL
jgi:2'-5' RNA ligase